MNLRRFYTNPEVRRITVKFIIILLLGAISIYFVSLFIVKNISKTLMNQNTIILAETLQNKPPKDIIKNFYTDKSDEELEDARVILKGYGYDENLSLNSNEITLRFFKEIIKVFVPMFLIYIIILYLMFLRALKDIFSQVETIV